MEYTISKLANLAGVSTRTLRYYDEINLLKPTRINSSGYRIYGQHEVDKLQHILFYRELEVDLETIKLILNNPSFDRTIALQQHYKELVQKRSQLDQLIETVEKTIAHEKGAYHMNNNEKFKVFKDKVIKENEKKYGEEIREKYGDNVVDNSNAKLRGMSMENFEAMETLGAEILELLPEALKTGDPSSELAQRLAAKHKQWLSFTWSTYSKEAHAGLAEMYVADERFKEYYDKAAPSGAEFLRDAILIFLNKI